MKGEGCKGDPGVLLLGFGCASAPAGASRWPVAEARTHRKGRDVCATRPGRMSRPLPTVGNEAGMWPGINGFTNWRLTSPCRLGARGRVAAPGSEGVRRGRQSQPALITQDLNELLELSC